MPQWKNRHIKKKPWKVGEVAVDVNKDYSHLKHAPSPESQKMYRASTPIAVEPGALQDAPAAVPEEEAGLEKAIDWAAGASAEELLEAMAQTDVEDILEESNQLEEVIRVIDAQTDDPVVKDPVYKKSEFYDQNPLYEPIFTGYKEGDQKGKQWYDVTGIS